MLAPVKIINIYSALKAECLMAHKYNQLIKRQILNTVSRRQRYYNVSINSHQDTYLTNLLIILEVFSLMNDLKLDVNHLNLRPSSLIHW